MSDRPIDLPADRAWEDRESVNGPSPTALMFAALRQSIRRLRSRSVPAKVLLTMTSQLSTMLGAGCDLCNVLESMARQQANPRMKIIAADLHESVKGGHAFSQALAKHPDVFDSVFVTMIRAGESSGMLRAMLTNLHLMIRNQIRITSSIRSAMMYPCILTTVALTAITVMTTFVLPRFAAIFQNAHVKLPLATTILLTSSTFVGQHCVGIFLGILTTLAVMFCLMHHPAVRRMTHLYSLRVPLLGYTLRLAYVVRTIQTFGGLIKSGLPLAESLVLIRDMVPNMYYRQFFDQLRTHIAEGKALAPDFEQTTLFPPMVTQMIGVGEQSGTLAQVCQEVASFHEEEMQERIKIMMTMLEPAIIIVLGGVVGFIAISVILPMFRISAALGGH